MDERVLAWDGCNNVRDLGGLGTLDGRTTRWKAIVRSDTPSRLTEEGWSALYDYGIRTIVTLRTFGITEEELDFESPYPDLATVQVEIEDVTDKEFVNKWVNTNFWGTPLYYRDALERWPERHAAVISAIARAQPGGVLFHCKRGYDRTGMISLLLLALVGVTPEEIAADYEMSVDPFRDNLLARENTSALQVLRDTLEGLDLERYLVTGGAGQEDIAAVRKRLLG